ncbi:MAG: hypothetical protein AAGA73_04025, partial [Pseudomonadota bacterium]
MRTLFTFGAVFALAASPLFAGSATAGKAFVSNEKGNTITVVDTETWEAVEEFPAGNRPRGITVSPD